MKLTKIVTLLLSTAVVLVSTTHPRLEARKTMAERQGGAENITAARASLDRGGPILTVKNNTDFDIYMPNLSTKLNGIPSNATVLKSPSELNPIAAHTNKTVAMGDQSKYFVGRKDSMMSIKFKLGTNVNDPMVRSRYANASTSDPVTLQFANPITTPQVLKPFEDYDNQSRNNFGTITIKANFVFEANKGWQITFNQEDLTASMQDACPDNMRESTFGPCPDRWWEQQNQTGTGSSGSTIGSGSGSTGSGSGSGSGSGTGSSGSSTQGGNNYNFNWDE